MVSRILADLESILDHLRRQGIWVLMGRIYLMAASLIASIFFARLLSVEDYGEYRYILASFALFAIFSITETHQVVIRYVPRGFDRFCRELFRQRLRFSCLGSLVLLLIGLSYIAQSNLEKGALYLTLALIYPFYYSLQIFDAYLQSKQRFKELNVIYIVRSTSQILSILVTYYFFQSITLTILSMFLVVTCVNYFSFRYVKFPTDLPRDQQSSAIKEDMKRESLVLSIIGVLPIVVEQLDKILIAKFIDLEALAVFSIGLAFGKAINGFFKPLMSSINAKLVHRKLDVRHYFLLFLSGSVLGLSISLFVPHIVTSLYGAPYTESARFAVIVISSMGLYFWHTVYYNQNMFNKEASLRKIYINNITIPVLTLCYLTVVLLFFETASDILWFIALIYPMKLGLSILTIYAANIWEGRDERLLLP